MSRRRGIPIALITIATLLSVLAIFSIWANRQLLNTTNWTDTSTKLLENDAIREQVSINLVDQLYANVDVEQNIQDVLPKKAAPLAPPIAGQLKTLSVQGVDKILTRPKAQRLWAEANRRAHRQFLRVVEDKGTVVSTDNGNVTLDLKQLLGVTQSKAGVGGRVQNKLPASATQIVILKSNQLSSVQNAVKVLRSLALVLVIVALGLYAIAIAIAKGWRREALRATGIGFAFAGILVLLVRTLAGHAVVDSLAQTESVKPAIQATWDIGTELLQEAASAALFYGIVIFLAAWIAGPTKFATVCRRGLAPYIKEPAYAWGGFVVLVLALLAWGPTPALRAFFTALLLIILLAIGFEFLRRQTKQEFPDASLEAATESIRAWFAGIFSKLSEKRHSIGSSSGGGRPPDKLSELEHLGRLKDSGVLTTAEFKREKAKLLSS
jgi:hypothetical protein